MAQRRLVAQLLQQQPAARAVAAQLARRVVQRARRAVAQLPRLGRLGHPRRPLGRRRLRSPAPSPRRYPRRPLHVGRRVGGARDGADDGGERLVGRADQRRRKRRAHRARHRAALQRQCKVDQSQRADALPLAAGAAAARAGGVAAVEELHAADPLVEECERVAHTPRVAAHRLGRRHCPAATAAGALALGPAAAATTATTAAVVLAEEAVGLVEASGAAAEARVEAATATERRARPTERPIRNRGVRQLATPQHALRRRHVGGRRIERVGCRDGGGGVVGGGCGARVAKRRGGRRGEERPGGEGERLEEGGDLVPLVQPLHLPLRVARLRPPPHRLVEKVRRRQARLAQHAVVVVVVGGVAEEQRARERRRLVDALLVVLVLLFLRHLLVLLQPRVRARPPRRPASRAGRRLHRARRRERRHRRPHHQLLDPPLEPLLEGEGAPPHLPQPRAPRLQPHLRLPVLVDVHEAPLQQPRRQQPHHRLHRRHGVSAVAAKGREERDAGGSGAVGIGGGGGGGARRDVGVRGGAVQQRAQQRGEGGAQLAHRRVGVHLGVVRQQQQLGGRARQLAVPARRAREQRRLVGLAAVDGRVQRERRLPRERDQPRLRPRRKVEQVLGRLRHQVGRADRVAPRAVVAATDAGGGRGRRRG